MKKLATIALTALMAGSALAGSVYYDEREKSFGDHFDDIGDVVFAPIKVSNYDENLSSGQEMIAEMSKMFIGFGYPIVWVSMAITTTDFHKKMVESKAIVSNATPRIISNADIDTVLARVNSSTGLSGSNRIVLLVDSLEHSRHTTSVMVPTKVGNTTIYNRVETTHIDQQINQGSLTSGNVDDMVDNVNRPAPNPGSTLHMERVIAKEITKEELERALQALSNNNIKAHTIKVGTVKTSALKAGGSVLAVYLTLDMIHSIKNFDM